MNVFEFAMQMEKDGEAYYRQIAENTKNPGLKKIFETLADEEVVHYNTFKKLAERNSAEVVESNILTKSKNIFAEMKEAGPVDLSDETPQTDAYLKAMDAEKEAYTFYEEKAAEAEDEAEKKILLVFAREERRHYRLLENIQEFVAQPDRWIEDGEFVNIDEY